MYRNNGREIARRLIALRNYLIAHADKTHAVRFEDIHLFYDNSDLTGDNGKPINRKTIYSDLHALQEIPNDLDFDYDEKAKGWLLYNPPFDDFDLCLIIESIQASKFITQTEAKKLTEKIRQNFGNGRVLNLDRHAYVYDRIRSKNDSVVRETDRIHRAIAADRKIGFLYFHMRPGRRKEYSNSGKHIIVSPFALYWNGGNLYLYAYDGKKFRYYRVDRMERISQPLAEKREGKDLYDVKSLTRQKAKVFQMYAGKEYSVEMLFRNELADAVIDQFGSEIMMLPEGREHFSINVPVEVSPPFYAWIATFGRRAKIIGPPQVVAGMKDFLQKASEMYENEGNI